MSKSLVGIVSSHKPDKSIIVTVQMRKTHPLYKKQYTVSKRYMAHDEKNEAQTGDKVSITECRPLSARKRHQLTKIIERPLIRGDQSVEAVTALPADEQPKPAIDEKNKPAKTEKKQ